MQKGVKIRLVLCEVTHETCAQLLLCLVLCAAAAWTGHMLSPDLRCCITRISNARICFDTQLSDNTALLAACALQAAAQSPHLGLPEAPA